MVESPDTNSYSFVGELLSGGLMVSYTYDANGNATKDRTGMTFTYNHLNLPKTAIKTGTSVSYLYDATGTVIQKHDYSFVSAFYGIHELTTFGYYPFGKAKALVTSGINKYLYNSKEVQDEIGGQYDYSIFDLFFKALMSSFQSVTGQGSAPVPSIVSGIR